MFDNVLDFLSIGIQTCSSWFMSILQSIGALPSLITFFLAYCAFRFLLLPLFGFNVAGSDRAFGKGNDDIPALPEGSRKKRRK